MPPWSLLGADISIARNRKDGGPVYHGGRKDMEQYKEIARSRNHSEGIAMSEVCCAYVEAILVREVGNPPWPP